MNGWSDADRQALTDAAMDIANLVAAGLPPREDDVARFRELQSRRDAPA